MSRVACFYNAMMQPEYADVWSGESEGLLCLGMGDKYMIKHNSYTFSLSSMLFFFFLFFLIPGMFQTATLAYFSFKFRSETGSAEASIQPYFMLRHRSQKAEIADQQHHLLVISLH